MTRAEAEARARATFDEAWKRVGPVFGLTGSETHDRFVAAHIDAIADALIEASRSKESDAA